MSIELPRTVELAVDDIKPYWRNPRRIPADAIEAVAESIRLYGYQQPIVVDPDHVIIVGHTRHLALQRLGWKKVPVYVADLPEEKAKEYRLIDNRTGELTSWDHNALVLELREWEQGLLEQFFPDVDLEIGQVAGAVTDADIAAATDAINTVTQADPLNTHTTEVVCPSCFHRFAVKTKSLPGLTYADLDVLVSGAEQAAPAS